MNIFMNVRKSIIGLASLGTPRGSNHKVI